MTSREISKQSIDATYQLQICIIQCQVWCFCSLTCATQSVIDQSKRTITKKRITYSELWNIYNKNECQIWCVFGRRPCDSGNNWKCWLNQKFEIFNEQIKYLSRAIDSEFIYTFPNTIEEDWLVLHYQCISEYERNNALWEILLVYY